MVEKLIRAGRVAVLVSPGYGAGWSTWASGGAARELLFDRGLAELVLDKALLSTLEEYAEDKWPDQYLGGLENLTVRWLPEGTAFRVDEYDGFESIVTAEQLYEVA